MLKDSVDDTVASHTVGVKPLKFPLQRLTLARIFLQFFQRSGYPSEDFRLALLHVRDHGFGLVGQLEAIVLQGGA